MLGAGRGLGPGQLTPLTWKLSTATRPPVTEKAPGSLPQGLKFPTHGRWGKRETPAAPSSSSTPMAWPRR